jgi:hypothetical protein
MRNGAHPRGDFGGRSRVAVRRVVGLGILIAGLIFGTEVATRLTSHSELFTQVSGLAPGQASTNMAYVIMSPADCPDYLETVELLRRPTIRARIPYVGVQILGGARDTFSVRRALEDRGLRFPIGTLTSSALASLEQLGLAQTPTLLVFGTSGDLELMYPLPKTGGEWRDFVGLLSSIPGASAASANDQPLNISTNDLN